LQDFGPPPSEEQNELHKLQDNLENTGMQVQKLSDETIQLKIGYSGINGDIWRLKKENTRIQGVFAEVSGVLVPHYVVLNFCTLV
jgi:hypothetical protein